MLSCLFYNNMAQSSAKTDKCCGSSVVEHSLGKGEVESSILSRSTIPATSSPPPAQPNLPPLQPFLHRCKSALHPLLHTLPKHSPSTPNHHPQTPSNTHPLNFLTSPPWYTSNNHLITGKAQSSTPSAFSLPTQSACRPPLSRLLLDIALLKHTINPPQTSPLSKENSPEPNLPPQLQLPTQLNFSRSTF